MALDDPAVIVRLRVSARARRLTLRVDGAGPVLTLPPGVSLGDARMFLMRQADWLRGALARMPERVAVAPGLALPVDGTLVQVLARPGPRRAPVLEDGALVLQGAGAPGPRIATWLRARAQGRLVPATHAYAARLGRRVAAIGFKDTRSRWGSCSTRGHISYSWRLAMAPVAVQEYVAAHEAAHLAEMSHALRYWAVLAALMPDYAPRRQWLTREGATLHRYRFEA